MSCCASGSDQEILEAYLADNVKARILQKDGSYVRTWQAQGKRKPPMAAAAFNAQDFFLRLAEGKQALDAIPAAPVLQRRTLVGKER